MVVRLLDTEDNDLLCAALDILGRRGWSGPTVDLVRGWLAASELTSADQQALRGALLAMDDNGEIQRLIADALEDEETIGPTRQLLLDVIARCSLETLPDEWRPPLEAGLASGDPRLAEPAIRAAARFPTAGFGESLLTIARSPVAAWQLRVSAASAVVRLEGPLPDDLFELLLESCRADSMPADRLLGAEALSAARLTEAQLGRLAPRLATAGPLEVRALVRAFARPLSPDVATSLIEALGASPGLAGLPGAELRAVTAHLTEPARGLAEELLDRLQVAPGEKAERMQNLQETLGEGDAGRGRVIFFGKKASCYACHRADDQGSTLGPDLSRIGQVRTRRDLLEATVYPSATLARGYESYTLHTSSGKVFNGLIARQTIDAVYLRTAERAEIRVPRDDIEELLPGTVSVMPQGLDKILEPREMSDLLAYLESLRGS